MDKEQVAAILDEIGTLLELQGENPFRCNAYHNAARSIEQLETNLQEVVQAGKLDTIAGIGETLRDKITTLVTTGRLPFYEDLRKKTPQGLIEMLRVQGLGPKKVKVLYEELGIDSLEKLKTACATDQVAQLRGFGAKTQQKILEGLEFLSQMGQRVRIDQAQHLAERVLEGLRECPGVLRMEVCGSLRRRKETIRDIDILISSAEPRPIMERFVNLPDVEQVLAHGETKSSVTVAMGRKGHAGRIVMNVDLRIVSDQQFPFALHYFTGSKEHNIAMRVKAQQHGLKLNEYGLTGDGRSSACKDETDLYQILGMDYIPPELREHTGELDAAAEHTLPRLIELKDIRGVFHCHTDWSDGGATLEEMVEATQQLGLHYLGIADHSQSLTVANGLSPERVHSQQKKIDALNKHLKDFKVFKGIECDILADGSLDYEEEVLASFDYVVASVHSHFQQPREEMTQRIIRAIENPYVTMLGHSTGRLLLRREGYHVDLEAVLQAAAACGTMIEINAQPMRLDLDWIHCKRAKTLGVELVINPDAHSPGEVAYYNFGIDVARRGWLEKKDVFNTKSLAQVSKVLGKKGKKRQ